MVDVDPGRRGREATAQPPPGTKNKKKLYIFIINPKDPQYIKHWCHENIYTLQHGDCPPPNSVCKCAGTHVYKEHTGEPPLIKTTKSLFTFMQFILKEKKKKHQDIIWLINNVFYVHTKWRPEANGMCSAGGGHILFWAMQKEKKS